jgi:ATP-dependent Clp protease adapter protein ClpS
MGLIALFSIAALFVGLLLYLPFFLWFRSRRGRALATGRELRATPAGYLLIAAQVAALFGGYAAGVVFPETWPGSLVQDVTGMLWWAVSLVVLFSVVDKVLQSAGVALERSPPVGDIPAAVGPPQPSRFLGPWKLATIRGVPFFIHGSFPIGGLAVAALAKAGVAGSIAYCLAFAVLIAVHELGHFVAARALDLRVFRIDISGLGGRCLTQLPRSVKQTFVVYSAGIAAQALLFVLTQCAVAVLGAPQSPAGRSVFITFTAVNLMIAVVNLVPGKVREGLSTDGAILWELFLHVFRGRPHPLAKQHAVSPVFSPESTLLSIDGMKPAGFTVGIELLNDDATPMEFVIGMLETHLKLDREAAIASMLTVHNKGGLLLPLTDLGEAEMVAAAVMRDARAQGHPLICRAIEA